MPGGTGWSRAESRDVSPVVPEAVRLEAEAPAIESFELEPAHLPPLAQRLPFTATGETPVPQGMPGARLVPAAVAVAAPTATELAGLKPLGQVSNSFIVAGDASGLWLVDQHVAPGVGRAAGRG